MPVERGTIGIIAFPLATALLQGRRDMPLGEALRQRLQEAGITACQDGQLT